MRTREYAAWAAAELPARCLGVALVVASCDPARSLDNVFGAVLVVAAVVFAWWAAPMADRRPVRKNSRWRYVVARQRSTVLPAASVVLAAVTDPGPWLAACVVALLPAYLLLTDAWTRGATAPRLPRPWAAPLAAYTASGLVLLAANAPAGSTGWARLAASVALLATAAVATLALWQRARTDRETTAA